MGFSSQSLHQHKGDYHVGPTILRHHMIGPSAVIFLGVCFALFVPKTYQYPPDDVPSTMMPSHGEEICGYPRLLGGNDKNATRDSLSFFARSRSQVFDVKLMAEIDALCDVDRPPVVPSLHLELSAMPWRRAPHRSASLRGKDKGRSKASLWIEVAQLSQSRDGVEGMGEKPQPPPDPKDLLLYRKEVVYDCSGVLLERIITVDISTVEGYKWGAGGGFSPP